MIEDFYEVFAGWARKTSLKSALKTFKSRLTAEEYEAYEAEYRQSITVIVDDGPPVIHGPREPWYAGPNEGSDTYWPALDTYIRSDLARPDDRVASLDGASSKVSAYSPGSSKPDWVSKWLVVGYVRSGKTTNFTAVIAEAADVGYRFIIVLSGIHNALRRQTQERIQPRDVAISGGGRGA